MSSNIVFSNKQSNGSYLDGFVEASVEMPPDGLNGECIVHYSGQYSGYRMRVKLVNGVREGRAVIEKGNEPYMRLEYKRGSLTGGVEKVKSSGSVELSGHLVGGVEDAAEREERKRREREEEEREAERRSGALLCHSLLCCWRRKNELVIKTNGEVAQGVCTRRTYQEVNTVVVPSSLTSNPQTIEELRIGNNSYSDSSVTELKLSGLVRLKRIVIGDECFGSVRVFELNGLSELESLVIGEKSFRISGNVQTDGVYRIVNCPKLQSIQIGDYSFSDYHSFELTNLPSLQSIDIGSHCFFYASSFSLTGLID